MVTFDPVVRIRTADTASRPAKAPPLDEWRCGDAHEQVHVIARTPNAQVQSHR
jgi:hypothetical protein